MRYYSNSKKAGYTLIEVMMAVAIISILGAIAIPAYNGYILAGRMVEAKNNIAAIKLAEEEFFLENNSYFFDDTFNNGTLKTASQGLWEASKGDNDQVNFDYAVTASSGYTITAKGKSGTKVNGQTAYGYK